MKQTLLHKSLLASLLVAAGALTGGQAIAQALYFDQQAGWDPTSFVEFTPLNETFSGPLPVAPPTRYPAGTVSDLSWAFGAETPSSLNITTYNDNNHVATGGLGGTSPSSGNPALGDTNGNGLWESSEWFTITRLTQTNNVINGFGVPLWSVNAIANLEIFADAAHLIPIFSDLGSPTGITFNETLNATPCTPNQTGTVCEDYYLTLLTGFAPLEFKYQGSHYFVDFRVISPDGSALIDTVGPNLRIITPENAPGISLADVQIHWTNLPEPGILGLIGIGLLGFGFAKRRELGV